MTLNNATVLVTGATGFLGSHLVKRLAEEGACVKALARRPDRDRYIKDLSGVNIVMGDITDTRRMKELARDVDYIFHVAAALGGNLDYQKQVNVEGTASITYAAVEANIKRLIHVSSIAFYGFPPPELVTETTDIMPTRSPYNLTKASAEATLHTIATSKNLSYSIIRPALIYGARSHAWTVLMFKLARFNPTPFVGDGSGYAHAIHVSDVVDIMITTATHPQAHQQTFNCAPVNPPTWREYLGQYSALVGHNNWISLPESIIKAVAPLPELAFRLTGEPRDLPAMVDFITSNTKYSMQKAKDLLGWQPSVILEDGIQSCIPYLTEKGLL